MLPFPKRFLENIFRGQMFSKIDGGRLFKVCMGGGGGGGEIEAFSWWEGGGYRHFHGGHNHFQREHLVPT